ncbi:hypothetical protein BOX15_Mlig030061g1 [Macrostomum lignano]|uniref:Cadherin domain-containing protein n=1 Tax=Macrostomum lignano TaxID=282301 RepID=A0A267F7Y4_9PLAT|nr:hypothetical protein BOX15_Mlig030061g1 [Macrostomum lignano]
MPPLLRLLLLQLLVAAGALAQTRTVTLNVEEKTAVDTPVGTLNAQPAGGSYFVKDGYFAVNQDTGVVTVKAPIDRDLDAAELCNLKPAPINGSCVREFTVMYDGGRFILVRIGIADRNDHSPQWGVSRLDVSFPENVRPNTARSISPTATDPDLGRNSVTAYRMRPDSPSFRLEVATDPITGALVPKLVVQQELDREITAFYNFTLTAEDGGGRQTSVPLTVTVLDVNDESPVFQQNAYAGSVREDASNGWTVLTVLATDKDIGLNGNVSYRFATETPKTIRSAFDIGLYSGSIFVRDSSKLDYETDKQYEFSVVARDAGSDPKEDRASVIINVIDVNDQKPEIELYWDKAVTVMENKVNATVVTLMVSDKDAGQAGEFDCSITDREQYFTLTKLNTVQSRVFYRMATKVGLDREEFAVQNPTVSCTDRGLPPLTNSLPVTVQVLDENDSPPVFVSGGGYFRKEFAEGNSPGDQVLNVTAVDRDVGENARLTYQIVWKSSETSANPFEIDANGLIRARETLDRERNPAGFEFSVTASDGPHVATATVSIPLIDINDNPPVFDRQLYQFRVTETDSTGQHVGDLNATDADAGSNGLVRFALHPAEVGVPFQLPSEGPSIYTLHPIDREFRASYQFRVIAFDQGATDRKTATATVSVVVADVNDCDPVFQFPTPAGDSEVRLSYQEPSDFQVAEIRATDADAGANSKLTFSLKQGNLYERFSIDPDSGKLYVKKPMSRSDMGVTRLTITATDSGSPQRSAEAALKIRIDDRPPTSLLKDAWSADMETNKLIIICIVVATGVICAILITAICLMARKQPCSAGHISHELVQSSPRSGGGRKSAAVPLESSGMVKTGSGGGGGGGGGNYSLPLVDRDYDSRFGQQKLDTFLQPHQAASAKLVDEQSDSVPESDGDSGKGGSVSNSNNNRPPHSSGSSGLSGGPHHLTLHQHHPQLHHGPQTSSLLGLDFPGSHPGAPGRTFVGGDGSRSMTLQRQSRPLPVPILQPQQQQQQQQQQPLSYQTLGHRSKPPPQHMIMEDTGGSLV